MVSAFYDAGRDIGYRTQRRRPRADHLDRLLDARPRRGSSCGRAAALGRERACTPASSTWSRATSVSSCGPRAIPYEELIGKVSLERGEGLAWWAAERNEPAFIPDNLLADPRVAYVPELDEERFQSLLSVPIAARDGDGDRSHQRPHGGTPRVHAATRSTSSSRAPRSSPAAIENARLYDETRARVRRARGDHRARRGDRRRRTLDELLPEVVAARARAAQGERLPRLPARRRAARSSRSAWRSASPDEHGTRDSSASPSSGRSSRAEAERRASPFRSSRATSCSGFSSPSGSAAVELAVPWRARSRSASRRSS